MVIRISLKGRGNRWTVTQPRIRIGRESHCEVMLPEEFGMVSREHLTISQTGGAVAVQDHGSANGTFLNEKQITQATLASGDVLRLGSEGPELVIEFEAAAEGATILAGSAHPSPPTAFAAPSVPGPATVLHDSGHAAAPARAAAAPAKVEAKVDATVLHKAPPPPAAPMPAQKIAAPPSRAAEESSTISQSGEMEMLEHKLNAIRNLLAANLVAVLALIGLLFYQGQQINRNREALVELRAQAQGAISQFTPALDERLGKVQNSLDVAQKQMNGLDQRIQQAEDHFVARLNREMPAVLDSYLNKKMQEMKRQGLPSPR